MGARAALPGLRLRRGAARRSRHCRGSWRPRPGLGGLLAGPTVTERPEPDVWSALEYACHVRDVHRLFDERVALMLDEDDPEFANWDQDETAIADDYHHQDPARVAVELVEAAGAVAGRYAAVSGEQWQRRGRRSDGSEFTVETTPATTLHDVVHHAHDVGLEVGPGGPKGEAHGVLGADRRGARSRRTPGSGRSSRSTPTSAAAPSPGARRGRGAQGGLARRVAGAPAPRPRPVSVHRDVTMGGYRAGVGRG